jgi:hypothetical protein
MLQVAFEPTNQVFERTRTVHALDRAATVIGALKFFQWLFQHIQGQASYSVQ